MGIELTVKSTIKKTSSNIWPWRFWIRRGMLDGSNAHVLFPKSSSRFEFITADIHTDATTFTDLIFNTHASHRKVEFHKVEFRLETILKFCGFFKKWIFYKNWYCLKSGYFQDGKITLTATDSFFSKISTRLEYLENIHFLRYWWPILSPTY